MNFFSSKTHIPLSFAQDIYDLLFTGMNIFNDVNVDRNILINSLLMSSDKKKMKQN